MSSKIRQSSNLKSQNHSSKIKSFQKEVWKYYKQNGRHDLPWRKTKDPYRILVSEVMLQQTQVPRVIEKYKSFLKKFPTAKKLVAAPLVDVLREWNGLGYNRRGKYLHDAAKRILSLRYSAEIVSEDLDGLPGVGPYTANAVRVFAFNEPHVLIETNVRAAFIHHFFDDEKVSDKQLLPFIEQAAKGQDPREWHWALMDYGVHIKKLHKNLARRSAHYAKQSKFEGSPRQVRGKIVRVLAHEQLTMRQLMKGLNGKEREKWERALAGLQKDGLIKKEKGKWCIT
ncbi:A/G-specific adenine glycosylase [Candidatus Parcubacteria bacterium]|nr:MAG: A/G-specific adenine glycosylase [Candidatus Parcubacteria bacterium]